MNFLRSKSRWAAVALTVLTAGGLVSGCAGKDKNAAIPAENSAATPTPQEAAAAQRGMQQGAAIHAANQAHQSGN